MLDDTPLGALFLALLGLIALSAFFSGSETGIMTLNRYRLRHLAKAGHRGASLAQRLLERPDRLIGWILIGNNFVNSAAAAIATLIGLKIGGEEGVAIATGLLTICLIVFAEVTPKTFAALYPERLGFPAAYIHAPLIWLFRPLIWGVNFVSNGLLALIGVRPRDASMEPLSQEELRTVVMEAGAMIPQRHQRMLLNVLDLEKVTVEDIMIPRNEIVGLDLDDDWDTVLEGLTQNGYRRLPVFRGDINNVVGFLQLRRVLPLLLERELTREKLEQALRPAYFIPEGTTLNEQLLRFQRARLRFGLVVDEYGDVLGLVTLEDILEEIVGEFTTDPGDVRAFHPQEDGSLLVEGTTPLRVLNRTLGWQLPTDDARTLNGLILHYLETIPEAGTSLRIAGHPMEVVQTTGRAVKTVRLHPGAGPGGAL